MDAAQEYIRQHVGRMAAKKATPSVYRAQTIVIPPRKEKSDSLSTFLVFFILLLACGTLGVMFLMSPKGKEFWARFGSQTQTQASQPSQTPQTQPVPDFMRRDDAQQFMSSVNQRVGKLEDEVKVWKHRIWLLGIANNENAVLMNKMDADHHQVKQRGFVKFNENWQLMPVPTHLQLTEEQKRELEARPKKDSEATK